MSKNAVKVHTDTIPHSTWQHPLIQNYIRLQLFEKSPLECTEGKAQINVNIKNNQYKIDVHFDNHTENTIGLESKLEFVRNDTQDQNQPDVVTKHVPLGGMEQELKKLSEIINDFDSGNDYGAILVHGMPGTGKTLLVNHVANASKRTVFRIHASQFSSRALGQNEQFMKRQFHDARQNTPSIMIFDELHFLCPPSSKDQNTNRRLVRTLLGCIDELQRDKQNRVIVIGICNDLNSIDPEVRRSGRFDHNLECTVPTTEQRKSILNAILSTTQNYTVKQQYYQSLAETVSDITHGFVGADLKALCNEAVLQSKLANKEILSLDDFIKAATHVRPSAIQEVVVEVPHVRWDDIGGQEHVKQSLKEAVEWQLLHAEQFRRMNIRPPRGILLYGPPGCSKTMMAKALATETKCNFLAVRGPELFSKWVGESERAVRDVFRRARAAAPSVVFFDEIDALGIERGSSSNVGDRVLSQLLSELDGIDREESLVNDVTIVAATNRPDILDKALMRPGRMDRLVYVSPPDHASRVDIISLQLKRMANDLTEEQVKNMANRTDGYSGAELVAMCREAAYQALRQDLNCEKVMLEHFEKALASVKPRITREMLSFYESFAKN
jgi:SpoVK/Ycf46/Vps4 family AAA+-type ATPase